MFIHLTFFMILETVCCYKCKCLFYSLNFSSKYKCTSFISKEIKNIYLSGNERFRIFFITDGSDQHIYMSKYSIIIIKVRCVRFCYILYKFFPQRKTPVFGGNFRNSTRKLILVETVNVRSKFFRFIIKKIEIIL